MLNVIVLYAPSYSIATLDVCFAVRTNLRFGSEASIQAAPCAPAALQVREGASPRRTVSMSQREKQRRTALGRSLSERSAHRALQSPSEAAQGGGSGPQGGAQGRAPVRRQHRMCGRRTPGTRSEPGGAKLRKARTQGCPCLGDFYDSGRPALRPSGRLRRSNAFRTHLWTSKESDSAGASRS